MASKKQSVATPKVPKLKIPTNAVSNASPVSDLEPAMLQPQTGQKQVIKGSLFRKKFGLS